MYTMTVDGKKLYDPILTEYALEGPRLGMEANRFATLTFTIHQTNPRYGEIRTMKSVVRLYRDGEIMGIFRPAKSRMTFRGGIEYTCEEMTACLNDIMRRPAEISYKTAREVIRQCLSDATAIAGDGEIFRPSVEYLRGILVNDSFPYLTASSAIGKSGTITIYNSSTGSTETYAPGHWGYSVVGTNMSDGAVADLSRALAALGYFGNTYVPDTRDYPVTALKRYLTAHNISTWANDVDIQQATVWQSLQKAGVYDSLLSEMREFVAELPATDEDWDAQIAGFPVTFGVGDTPASDTLDNGNSEDTTRRVVLTAGLNQTVTETCTLERSSRSKLSFVVSGLDGGECTIRINQSTSFRYTVNGAKTVTAYFANGSNTVMLINSGNSEDVTCEVLFSDTTGDKELISLSEDIDYMGYWNFLQTYLVDVYGGYLVPVWSETGCAINYVRDEDLNVSGQKITFGENMVDLFVESDCAEAYSTIIPVGKDGVTIESVHPYNQDFLTDSEAYSLYGRREIVKKWEDIATASGLYQAAMDWMMTKSLKLKDKITATAFDLRYTGADIDHLNFMDSVAVVNPRLGIDEYYPIRAVSLALDSPAANTYTLGNEPESVFDENKKPERASEHLSYMEKMIKTGRWRHFGGTVSEDDSSSSSSSGGLDYE